MGFAESRVENLTRRQAHAAYACLFASKDVKMPVSAEEVCLFDEEAISVRATASALLAAQRVGLVQYVPPGDGEPGLWVPTEACYGLESLLEDRYLRERGEVDG